MSQWQVLVDLAMGIGRANIFGFGGGPAVIPLIENEACERYHWLTQEEFANALVIGNSLPGPIATKMGTYIGYKLMGIPGAVVALTATVLPSALAMLLLFALLNKYRTLPFVKGMMNGVKPVVWVLFILLAIDYIKFVGDRQTGLIALGGFAALYFFSVQPVYVIVTAMLLGGTLQSRQAGSSAPQSQPPAQTGSATPGAQPPTASGTSGQK